MIAVESEVNTFIRPENKWVTSTAPFTSTVHVFTCLQSPYKFKKERAIVNEKFIIEENPDAFTKKREKSRPGNSKQENANACRLKKAYRSSLPIPVSALSTGRQLLLKELYLQ